MSQKGQNNIKQGKQRFRIIYILLAIQIICIFFIANNMWNHISDEIELSEIVQGLYDDKIHNLNEVSDKDKLIAVMAYLKSHISYVGLDKKAPRPILRASSLEILNSGKGFCGEYARVGIKMLHIAGINARRFYLFGTQWEHVILECELNSKWYLIDMFSDPTTAMTSNDIDKIDSPKFELLRNENPENPWVDYHRIRLFHNIGILNSFKDVKFPNFLIVFFESPYLIKSVVWFLLFLLSYYLKRQFNRTL